MLTKTSGYIVTLYKEGILPKLRQYGQGCIGEDLSWAGYRGTMHENHTIQGSKCAQGQPE